MAVPETAAERLARAVELHRGGRGEEAARLYRELAAEGGSAAVDARINHAVLLDDAGGHEDALSLYAEALAARENDPLVLNNMGNSLLKLGRFAEAVSRFSGALAASPGFLEARLGLGAALQRNGDAAGAIACFRAVVADHPDCAEGHWNLSLALLLTGEYREGWDEYRWRWEKESFTSPRRGFEKPFWDGSNLDGRTILVHGEQGFGDTIQFARYLPMAAERGGRVVVECQSRSLVPLLAALPGVAEVVAMGEALPPFDLQIPLLSLPHIFGTTLETVPDRVPYLAAPPEKVPLWRAKAAAEGLRVGLVWAGKPLPDPFRSTTLEALLPLCRVPGVTAFSLQVGDRGAAPEAAELVDLTSEIADFGDTAALIEALDLVVSVDTSVAHLAGALGKPVWLLLPMAADYRWLLEREDSPWYPTMRLFRQKRQGEWGEVVERVRLALEEEVPAHMRKEAALHPFDGRRQYLLGILLAERGEHREAAVRLGKAATLLTGSWEPLYAQAASLQQMDCYAEAAESLEEAVSLAPGIPLLHETLGIVQQQRGDADGAMASYREALRLDPAAVKARYNLASALQECGRFAEALEEFEEVVRRAPEHANAQWNRAVLLLMHGRLAEGWRAFSWRFLKSPNPPVRRRQDHPAWDGSPLHGRTILLYGEQGAGDAIQFLRYVPLVAQRGGRVLVEVLAPGLVAAAATVHGAAGVFAAGESLPPFDLQASLMDLPGIFGTEAAAVPAEVPYLKVIEERLRAARPLVPAGNVLNVGLIWRGNPLHTNDANRSLAPELLAPLGDVPGVAFHSLQVGGVKGETLPFPHTDLAPHIGDFADTAAFASLLDLVISVDTSGAHLCGALAVPVWLLVPFVPDWRWLLERDDSPWYPTMRLFRQKTPGGWDEVAARVREALCAAAGAPASVEGMSLLARAEAFNNEGCALDDAGNHLEAAARYRKSIVLAPRGIAPWYNMGNSLNALGRVDEAIDCYLKAVSIDPSLPQGWHNLALSLQGKGRLDEAEEAFGRSVAAAPGYLEARHNLGELRHARGDIDGAVALFRENLSRDPGYLPSMNALGIALQVGGRLEEAVACYEKALAAKPDYLHALNNLGAASRALGDLARATACYEKVLLLDPGYADARWNLGLVQLQQGAYREGWEGYEWRFKKVDPVPRLEFPRPLWDGAPLDGRTILLHAEQGFGDTLQFVRFATPLSRQGTVLVQCQSEAIAPVVATVPGVARVLVRGEPLPDFDCHAPLMSLPHLLGTELETVPADVPYLFTDPALVAAWKERTAEGGLKVGLVWAGRKTYKDDLKRSLTLALFAPLAAVAGVSFHSLQVGDGADQASSPPPGMALVDLGSGIRSFADTAAAMASLDLVITADSAPAHLAGGLGVPVWVLLPAACDWRWLTERDDSPWYPTARLFRQRRRGDWEELLERVAQALAVEARKKGRER